MIPQRLKNKKVNGVKRSVIHILSEQLLFNLGAIVNAGSTEESEPKRHKSFELN